MEILRKRAQSVYFMSVRQDARTFHQRLRAVDNLVNGVFSKAVAIVPRGLTRDSSEQGVDGAPWQRQGFHHQKRNLLFRYSENSDILSRDTKLPDREDG